MHVTLNHGTLNLGRAMKASFKAVVCVSVCFAGGQSGRPWCLGLTLFIIPGNMFGFSINILLK